MHRRIIVLVVLGILLAEYTWAQRNARTVTTTPGTPETGDTRFYANPQEPPRAIEFKKGTVTAAQFLAGIHQYLDIPAVFTFSEAEATTDKLGMRHHLLRQYYHGIPVEGMDYRVHEKDGFAVSANGKAVRDLAVNTQTTLDEAQAYQLAVQSLQAGDTPAQPGRKLIVSKGFTFAPESFAVAYQFDVDVSLVERWRVSIDARTGQLINKVSLVNTCRHEDPPTPPPYLLGTGETNYYGQRTIRVEQSGSGTRLVGQTQHGGLIGTYDYRNAPIITIILGIPVPVYDVTSSSTNYANTTHLKPAVSVQWAAEQAFEYYFQKHNRNSFDNRGSKITSYVHVDNGLDNAYWTGKLLVFGDGTLYNPLVELDVVSHELTHGVTQYEAGLQYAYESGALNESFSDIMAKAVEFHTLGNEATWRMGAHAQSGGLRDFSSPNRRDQPDTYQGDLWYTGTGDSGGVHYNSGVQNFWFYLLCQGGSGVNDHDVPYAVNAIGMEAAANIAYRNLTEYLTPLSDYLDSRLGSMLATADLYGKNSSTYQEVDKAWDAVGVIDEPVITSLEPYDITATTARLRGTLIPRGDSVHYYFEYGTTPALGNATTKYTYTGTVQGIVTGLQPSRKYYLRLVAVNEHGTTYSTTTEFTTIAPAPLVRIRETSDVTETTATLYGQVNPNSLPATFYFEYGPTPALGLTTPVYPAGDTTEFMNVSAPVTGLTPRTHYYYRLVAVNGFSSVTTESVRFFTAVKPIISAFTPITAPLETTVTITGQNFNTTPENNWVTFGATRAEVLSAGATEITVKVPAGASLGPIAVLDAQSGLTAESVREFIPTFSGGFSTGSLQLAVGNNSFAIYRPIVQDLDGDLKPDILGGYSKGYRILQNVHAGGDITDASFLSTTTAVSDFRNSNSNISAADLDGNGLADIVAAYTRGLRIYPNLSVPGYIFFGAPADLPIGDYTNVALRDFDGDGRMDIAYTNYSEGTYWLRILRNHNPPGSLTADNFRPQYEYPLMYEPYSLAADDLNNDGIPDLLLGSRDRSMLWMFRNNSRPDTFTFEEAFTIDPVRGRFAKYIASDLNADGWKEVILHSPDVAAPVAVWGNAGTSPQITLAAPIAVLTGYAGEDIKPGDLDGDGKPDLLVGTDKRELRLLQNQAVAGNPFSASSLVNTGTWGSVISESRSVQQHFAINDLNGDGRPEVINATVYYYAPHDGYVFEIWQNDAGHCLDPTLVTVDVTTTMATIRLPANTTFDQFEIEYSAGAGDWYTVYSTTMSNLSPGYPYQFRIRAHCRAGYTAYHYIDVSTECVDTNLVTLGAVGVNQVTLYAPDLSLYEIQYSPAGKNEWETLPYYYSTLYALKPGTTYDLRIRGRCVVSAPYRTLQFTTLCPSLAPLAVTNVTYNSAFVTGISYPDETIVEYSSDDIHWMPVDASRYLYPLVPGTRYAVRGTTNCANTGPNVATREFTTSCPKVYTPTADAITPTGARISWYDESSTDRYLIRYTGTTGGTGTAETTDRHFTLEGFAPGSKITVEVAPYCVSEPAYTRMTVTTLCYTPDALTVVDVTHTTAELTWSAKFNASPYRVDYTIPGTNVWQTIQTSEEHLTLTALQPGTRYEVRVSIVCLDQAASYTKAYVQTPLYEKTVYFPNPTDGVVTIHPSKNLIGNRFILCDNLGRILASGALPNYTIDLSAYPPGMYLLKIEGEALMKINRQ